MKLLLKAIDAADDRLAPLSSLLTTAWDVSVVDHRDRDALARGLATADAMVSMDWPAHWPEGPRLRLLQLPGAGTDAVDFDAVPSVTSVCNTFEHEIGIAEYVLCAMLEWTVGLRRLDAELRQGRWWGSYLCGPRHGDLHGSTLAVLGYGRIGRETARRASAFGVRVIAASRTPGPGDEWCERVHPMTDLHAVLSRADFVLCTLPLDDSTRGAVDAAAFAAMRPNAVVINVGRGPTVDETALFEACRDRRIGGAVIDTWYDYPAQAAADGVLVHPPSRHPFHTLDNVIMTPHASAWTHALAGRRCRVMAANLDRLARGEPLLNVVRPPRADRTVDPRP